MSFLGNLIKAPFKGIGDIVKGAVQTVISPFKATWDGLKTLGKVGWDLVSLQWTKIPGDAIKGTMGVVKDLGEGPLNMLRGTVGLGTIAAGTIGGTMLGGPLGGIAGYAASTQLANKIE